MISEVHDVETASQMVDTMQSLRVGVVYLALTVAPVSDHLGVRLPSICFVDLNK